MSDRSKLLAEIIVLKGDVERYRERCGIKDSEIERLRKVVQRHWGLWRFVHLWTHRDNVTDAERLSAIKNHPTLQAMFDGADEQQAPKENR